MKNISEREVPSMVSKNEWDQPAARRALNVRKVSESESNTT